MLALLVAPLLVALPLRAQDEGGSAYAIGGIAVDVVAATPDAARITAYRIAQRKAWPLLWARLTGGAPAAAPRLSDGQLDGIVAGIESQGERFSMTRYIAKLGVVFDRSRTSEFVGGGGSGALQSPPMLLLPLFSDGAVRTLYQAKTPWRAAWQRYRDAVTPIDYVTASGSAGDNIVLTGWQVTRSDRTSWRSILNRFDAVDVLTAEARLVRAWPGGPIRATFIARHGPDATELGRFELTAADDAGLDAMLDAAVRGIDDIYGVALRDGRLRSEPDLAHDLTPVLAEAPLIGAAMSGESGGDESSASTSIDVAMATPDGAAATALETAIRGTAGVTGVTMTSLSLGGTSHMLLSYAGSYETLLYALDGKGLRLASENGQMVLRRRREGDVPVPQPAAQAAVLPRPAAPTNVLPRPAAPAAVLPRPAAPTDVRPRPAAPVLPSVAGASPPRRPAEPRPLPPRPVDLLPKTR